MEDVAIIIINQTTGKCEIYFRYNINPLISAKIILAIAKEIPDLKIKELYKRDKNNLELFWNEEKRQWEE